MNAPTPIINAPIGTGQALYEKAKRYIPGGTQLLSKRPEMFLPQQWPAYFSRAQGVDVWDLDNNHYIDMCYNGIGACILGAADPDVDAAVAAAVAAGTMSTLNCPEEVELAELLCEIHPWADCVRYTRSGGEAMAVAVRLARAATGRDHVAFCGYHGWHDWYLSSNLQSPDNLDSHLLTGLDPAGVPQNLAGTAHPFSYNHIDELERIVEQYGDRLAAIVMEPIRGQYPRDNFLKRVRDLATRNRSVLIFDEITAAFRLNTGGAHLLLGVTPDIAVFAKAISNGYPMAAVIGIRPVMEAAQSTFISSTYWTERIGPAAALATIKKHRNRNVADYLIEIGTQVQQAWGTAGQNIGLDVTAEGLPPLCHLGLNHSQRQAMKTLFVQEMLRHGFLASDGFYATYAHRPEHVQKYGRAIEETFAFLKKNADLNTIEQCLNGPVSHTGFQRLT